MSALAKNETIKAAVAPKTANVVHLAKKPARKIDLQLLSVAAARNIVPPLIVLAIILGLWQILCSSPNASLPSPHQVWQESYDLIAYPFFNYGSQDIGLGWRVLVSLQRVAYGFGLAAIAGIVIGAVIGQSIWAMRGLDPIFQVLRTVPPLAWLPLSLAAFQDSNPSAIFVIFITSIWPVIINTAVGVRNILRITAMSPKCCGSTSSSSSSRSCCPRQPLHLHRSAHRHRPVMAGDRRSRNADRRRRHRLLHLGCVELLPPARHHRGPCLYRRRRLRPRQARVRHRQTCHARRLGQLRGSTMNAYLKLDHIDKHFDRAGARTEVLKDINLVIDKGEFVSIIGHSGCGKSTLLNLIAGLTPVSKGAVLLENREVNEPGPERAVVFQNHSLLPWLTVYENVNLAVSKVFSNKKSKAERHDWVMANLDLVQMAHAKDRRPSEISGGMKQRVGIARALSMEPKILLLDEPFGALDALTRAHLQDAVMEIHARLGNTMVMITHDVDEAVLLSDRIVMMTNGPAARIGEVLDVPIARPRNRIELASDRTYLKCREAVLKFLYERHRFVEAAE